MIPIARPLLGEEEKLAVWDVLQSGQLAQGERVAELERRFAGYVGAQCAVATSSGTTALSLALMAAGIGPGAEVITSPLTFIASASAIIHAGATPVLVDVNEEDFTLDVEQVEHALTPRTRAILPVSLYGQPADMPALTEVAERRGLFLLEDACQAHGAAIDGRRSGSWGAGAFSFYPTKNMTTGEGGMVTTDDPKLAERVRLLREHGMRRRYHHEVLGYNFRLTDLHAAVGLAQLDKLDANNARRRSIAARYDAELEDVLTPRVRADVTHVYHQYTLRVNRRNEFIERMAERGVTSAVYYPIPIHRQRAFAELPFYATAQPVCDRLVDEIVSIPVHPGLSESEVDRVIEAVNVTVRELGLLEPTRR